MRLTLTSKFQIASAVVPIAFVLLAAAPLSGCTAQQSVLRSLENTVFDARDRVFPALVHVQPILEVYQAGQRGRIAVTGSGVIFSPEGYVITNNHVVERAERVTCMLSDKQEVPATVVGRDPETDVAVIKLDLSKFTGTLHFARLGDSSKLQIGQQVMAMGSPLGLARSISLGVISSLDRYLPEDQMPAGAATGQFNTWIQTDAAINPGNSGGPLVNLEGEVIGINARAVTVFGENVGFAIPINLVHEVADQIIQFGGPRRSWLGVNWQPIKAFAESGAPDSARGVLVGGVVPNSPASRAGIRAGDVLVSYDGRPVTVRFEEELPPFRKLEADTPVGKQIPITVLRDGKTLDLSVLTTARKTAEAEDFECSEWGFTVRAINEEIARERNLAQSKGVIVTGTKRGSFAAEAQLSPGLVIESIEGRTIPDLSTFQKAYDELVEDGRPRILIIARRGAVLEYHLLKPSYDPASPRAHDLDSGDDGEDSGSHDGSGPNG